jgi:hypothetical protein
MLMRHLRMVRVLFYTFDMHCEGLPFSIVSCHIILIRSKSIKRSTEKISNFYEEQEAYKMLLITAFQGK